MAPSRQSVLPRSIVGLGVVRKSSWMVRAWFSRWTWSYGLMACREGVRLAVEWVHKRAVWETDCASVGSAINSCNLSRSIICFILQDIKSLKSQLPDSKVHAIKREQNFVAHKLARCAHVRKFGSEQQSSSHIYEEVWVTQLDTNSILYC
jgi:hypothetical protein